MAKKKVVRRKRASAVETGSEFGEEIETQGEDESFLDTPETEVETEETFEKAEGSTANAHAKKLAKKKSKESKASGPSGSFYTTKNPSKIIKMVVKARGVYEVYVGNLARNKTDLESMIKVWKKEGSWREAHQVEDAIKDIRAGLPVTK